MQARQVMWAAFAGYAALLIATGVSGASFGVWLLVLSLVFPATAATMVLGFAPPKRIGPPNTPSGHQLDP